MPASKFITVGEAREQLAEALSANLDRMIGELATDLGQAFDRPAAEVRSFIEELLLTDETMRRRLVDGLTDIEETFLTALQERTLGKWC